MQSMHHAPRTNVSNKLLIINIGNKYKQNNMFNQQNNMFLVKCII